MNPLQSITDLAIQAFALFLQLIIAVLSIFVGIADAILNAFGIR